MKIGIKTAWVVLAMWCWNVQAANIAVIAPKVGELEKYGSELVEGAQMAVDSLNEAGGVRGEKLNLIVVDDRCRDSFAVSAAQMMTLNSSTEDKVNLVVGPYCSNAFEQIGALYAEGKIVRIEPMPLSSERYNAEWPGVFKIGGRIEDEAQTFFAFYKKNLSGQNVALVYDAEFADSAEVAGAVQQVFGQNALANAVTLFDFSAYGEHYSSMAKEILLNNRVVYVLGRPQETARLIQNLQEESDNLTLFVDEYMATPFVFRDLGSYAEGIYVLKLSDMKDSADFTEELVGLRLKGREPHGLGVYSYAAVKLWSQMVEKAKSTDFAKVAAQGNKGSYELPWGKVSFVKGQAQKTGGYVIGRIGAGEYAQVD